MLLLPLLLPVTSLLCVHSVTWGRGRLILVASTRPSPAACPDCGQQSCHIHSRYQRFLADLPCGQQSIGLQIQVKRFYCTNPNCRRRTFSEPLSEVAERYQRRTRDAQHALESIGFALGGLAGSRLAKTMNVGVSRDTLLRLLRRKVPPATPTLRVIGIDDWAFRRGQRYGTLIVDLLHRRPVELLPDRTSDTVAAWLITHPEIRVINRDRAGAYAEAARRGAPQALQVADRWHLVKNLRELIERLLGRYTQAIRKIAQQLALPAESTDGASSTLSVHTPTVSAEAARGPSATSTKTSEAQRHTPRWARYQTVMALHHQGVPISTIAQQLKMHRRTVRGFIRADGFPERATPAPRPSKLTPFLPYLRRRWEEGCHNATQLWQEITAHGFCGALTLVNRAILPWRYEQPSYHRANSLRTGSSSLAPVAVPCPRQVGGWLLGLAPASDEAQRQRQTNFIERLCSDQPALRTAQTLAMTFRALMRDRQVSQLDTWLDQAQHCGLAEFKHFAQGLRRDYEAVAAAFSSPWSNGQTEGQVNRLKCLKRQMYGRARFDLLRLRVLAPT